VRNGAYREVLKVVVFVALAIWLGAWTATFFYNAGMALAEVTADKRTNGLFRELGEIFRGEEFPRFFAGTLVGVAGLLAVPFLKAVDWRGQVARGRDWRKGMAAFLLMAVIFGVMGFWLVEAGWLVKGREISGWKLWAWAGLLVVGEEWLFRGVVMGIFMKAMRGKAAIAWMAGLFALVHFLRPPAGFNVPDPDASGVGFELLGLLLGRLAQPSVWVLEILPLLAMGGLLGLARWRTGGWWLPLGLHAGWVVANDLLVGFPSAARGHWLIGGALDEGLIPLAGFLLAGWWVFVFTKPRATSPTGDA
jgi:membrane protease YdiL (CAAX protease family)